MALTSLVIDIATAPLPDAETYLEGTVRPPANYKDEEKIAAYLAEKQAERLQMAATDLDLARITAIGLYGVGIYLCHDTADERVELTRLAERLTVHGQPCQLITFGGFNFDLPMLMRRARYLGVTFPTLNLDRYRSPHLDLCEALSDRNPQRRRSLQFYAKRLGWTDLHKTLSGSEEAQVPVSGRWDDLYDSVEHDLEATARLARWYGAL